MSKGKMIIISAPSGTGKGTVISRMMELDSSIVTSVSATTRKPREGEENGVHYYFLTRDEFFDMVENGLFLEHAEYAGNLYGTPLPPIKEQTDRGLNVILEIDVQGFVQVKAKCPECIAVFIVPPSLEELELRLRSRGTDSEETILERLEIARTELLMSDDYDYIVTNDVVDRAAREILRIIEQD